MGKAYILRRKRGHLRNNVVIKKSSVSFILKRSLCRLYIDADQIALLLGECNIRLSRIYIYIFDKLRSVHLTFYIIKHCKIIVCNTDNLTEPYKHHNRPHRTIKPKRQYRNLRDLIPKRNPDSIHMFGCVKCRK